MSLSPELRGLVQGVELPRSTAPTPSVHDVGEDQTPGRPQHKLRQGLGKFQMATAETHVTEYLGT